MGKVKIKTVKHSAILISLKIKGTIGQEHIKEFFEQIVVIAKEDRKINLVLEPCHIDGLQSVNKFFSDIEPKRDVFKHVRRFVLIADTDWIGDLGDFIDLVTPAMDVKVFGHDEREGAKAWVQAPTKKEDHNLTERVKQGYEHILHQ